MLSPSPLATTATWPIAGDVPDLQNIVWSQLKTIANNAALIDAYQQVLNAAQPTTPATATGTGAGTTLTLSAVTGTVRIGAAVIGTGAPAGTSIVSQQTGPAGGAGNYTTSQPTTSSAAALTFAPGASAWPTATDAATLNLLAQDQTTVIRTQTALLQQYITLLNDSNTAAPPSGP